VGLTGLAKAKTRGTIEGLVYAFSALAIGLLLGTVLFWTPTSTVQAQTGGTVALKVSQQAFSTTAPYNNEIFTLGSVSQIGHLVNATWTSTTSGSICAVALEGTNSQTINPGANNWSLLAVSVYWNQSASGTPVNLSQQTVYANGFFSQLRLVTYETTGCTGSSVGLKVIYTGFATALPINTPVLTSLDLTSGLSSGVTAIQNVASGTPYMLQGLQCFNSGASATWIQLFAGTSTPTLGTTVPFYTAYIPATGSWNAPPLFESTAWTSVYYAAATTTRLGSSVSSGVTCDAQLNLFGPFYPFNLIDPNL